jgi:GNAT superfamily N-acetyltransferase
MIAGVCGHAADEVLRDGAPIHIRAIRPDDKERLLEHFHALGPRSVYYRFHGTKKRLTAAELSYFTDLDFVHAVGLVATRWQDGIEHILGVGRYFAYGGGAASRRAEVAFAVVDAYQGRGIGTQLVQHLARLARDAGITEFEAEVLGDNSRMLHVFARCGFAITRSFDAGVVHVAFPTEAPR